jgi:vanillate/3-O-methylgallate O-demethylase
LSCFARYEANASLGGSFVSNNIEDYYTTPHELGYASFTKFDHDFIGKEALQAMEGKRHRKKVTFAWNEQDVTRVLQSIFATPGTANECRRLNMDESGDIMLVPW